MYPILDDFNDTRTFTDKEIFTQLWTQPRAVLQYIHENQYEKYLNPLLFLLGVIAGLNRAVEKEMGDEIPLLGIIGGAILIGGLLGWISYYIYAGLVSWTGKWLNGVGNAYDVLRIFAYASIPTVLTLVLFAVQIIVYGNGVFSSEMTSTFVNYTTADILFYEFVDSGAIVGCPHNRLLCNRHFCCTRIQYWQSCFEFDITCFSDCCTYCFIGFNIHITIFFSRKNEGKLVVFIFRFTFTFNQNHTVMNIKTIAITLFVCLTFIQLYAQKDVQNLLDEGVAYHDNGQYDEAIAAYEAALKIEPKSALIHYEIALSHYAKSDYKKVLQYADVVLKQNGDYLVEAYLIKGSALDVMGKQKKAINLFQKGIEETEGHHLLHYNLALVHYNMNNLDDAEKNVIQAIYSYPHHATSHILLANIHSMKKNNVQALLAIHYFLFLEPDSRRSPPAYALLQKIFNGNVTKEDGSNTMSITILNALDENNQFGTAELMLGMLEASKSIEKNEGKSEDELFIQNTTAFFNILGELESGKDDSIWWEMYIPFFYELAQTEHMEAYCSYISQSANENAEQWMAKHEDKLVSFFEWLKTY